MFEGRAARSLEEALAGGTRYLPPAGAGTGAVRGTRLAWLGRIADAGFNPGNVLAATDLLLMAGEVVVDPIAHGEVPIFGEGSTSNRVSAARFAWEDADMEKAPRMRAFNRFMEGGWIDWTLENPAGLIVAPHLFAGQTVYTGFKQSVFNLAVIFDVINPSELPAYHRPTPFVSEP
jgi:hypothetical protein